MGKSRCSRAILIGGSSHVGKSTLAESLAAKLGWEHIPTDSLARHPGRPWVSGVGAVPERVADHYLSLTVEELLTDVLRHYEMNVWPKVLEIVHRSRGVAANPDIVVEGSALWPEFVIGANLECVEALWLTASESVFRQRIHEASGYRFKSGREKAMIDKFFERTLAYDALMIEIVNRHGFRLVDVSEIEISKLTDELSAID